MPKVIVTTDDGREVSRLEVPTPYQGNGIWRRMLGRLDAPLGWLGSALRDAEIIQAGGDPVRPSEKAITLAAADRRLAELRAQDPPDPGPIRFEHESDYEYACRVLRDAEPVTP